MYVYIYVFIFKFVVWIFKGMRYFFILEIQEFFVWFLQGFFLSLFVGDDFNMYYLYLVFLILYGVKSVDFFDVDIIFYIQVFVELNLFIIKVSVKIGKVMRQEEIQCKELNEE